MLLLRHRGTEGYRPTGRILVQVRIANALDPCREIECDALIDRGAWGMMLPRPWQERLGPLPEVRTIELVTADQRVVSGEVVGPVRIAIEGFRAVSSEVTFVEMEPEEGRYRPLVGYTILEQAGIAVDVVGHRLLKVPHMDLRSALASGG